MPRFVEVTRNGHILEVKLNKPKVNAIDHVMSREMCEAFALLRDDPELRVHAEARSAATDLPRIVAYDRVPGGVGLAEGVHVALRTIVRAMRRCCRRDDDDRSRIVGSCEIFWSDGGRTIIDVDDDRDAVAMWTPRNGLQCGIAFAHDRADHSLTS